MKLTTFLTSVGLLFFVANSGMAQTVNGDWCGSHQMYEEAIKNDKEFAKNQRELESFTQEYTKQLAADKFTSANKSNSVVRTIPVVVHVIHANGPENISKAQILSQIDVLNKDFRRLNADTNDTPIPFRPIAADSQIEFAMAKLDPNGNCTDGINRVYSPLTNQARNNVKALIYWPRNKYLNIWIVKTIKNTNGTPGNVIGFAQFPGGLDSTDGIVIAYDWMGTIGAAASQGGMGRTTTHEVGHWLNLRHIWGDDGTACSGSDNVADTPNQAGMNFSTCPNFPVLDACSPATPGVLYSDYMDYTAGQCQNTYTVGQAARMNAALASANSGRNNLWSAGNLAATGVSTPTILCKADFTSNALANVICENGVIAFTDVSYNGSSTIRNWSFPGGTLVAPSTLSDSIVSVQYPTPGSYSVSLTVQNATDSVSVTKSGYVTVLSNTAAYSGSSYTESFETAPLPNSDWDVANLDGDAQFWQQNTSVGFSGTACAALLNTSADSADIDELISPTFNAAAIPNLNFSFRVAYARKTASDNDALKIFTSVDCGKTWSLRTTIAAASLAGTNPNQTSNFVPTLSTQWNKQTVSVVNLANKTNARIKFQFISGDGNNIYLDDINILTPLGVNLLDAESLNLNLRPNPTNETSMLSFTLPKSTMAEIKLVSILGQDLENIYSGLLNSGLHQYEIGKELNLKPGIYFVKTVFDNNVSTQKLVIE